MKIMLRETNEPTSQAPPLPEKRTLGVVVISDGRGVEVAVWINLGRTEDAHHPAAGGFGSA